MGGGGLLAQSSSADYIKHLFYIWKLWKWKLMDSCRSNPVYRGPRALNSLAIIHFPLSSLLWWKKKKCFQEGNCCVEVWQVFPRAELFFCFLTCDMRLSTETRCLQAFARLALFKLADSSSWHGSVLGLDTEGMPWWLEEGGYVGPLQPKGTVIFPFQREGLVIWSYGQRSSPRQVNS